MSDLVIFDCDGVLVDSEPISVDVMGAVLRDEGLPIDAAYIYRHFLGRSMDSARATLLSDHGYDLGDDALARIRAGMETRLKADLLPVPGIGEALRKLTLPKCVASSSRPERIRLSLEITSLLDHFEPHIFSATMVQNGKPAPDLFLHAAAAMGVDPSACIVIEDSPAGVTAARSAGMKVFGFVGGAHAAAGNLHSALAELTPDLIFDDMLRLPELVAQAR